MSDFHKLKIAKIKRETTAAVAISFEIPENLKKDYQFIAGQYITLKTTIDGQEVRRAYSLCSSTNNSNFTIAVKAINKGFFSVYANNELKEGTEIEVGTPEGKFFIKTDANNQKNYLAFAAGSGITPIMSMLKSVLENEPNSKFVLVYGNKSTFETIFFDELNELLSKYKDRFFIQFVYSKEQPTNALFGRIDTGNINFVLNKYKTTSFNDVYVCGPEDMVNTVKETLVAKNYTENQIHFELFTSSTKKEATTESSLSGNSKITVLLDDEETTFSMQQKETILDAALKEKLDAPYSCQGGVCSSCIAKVKSGAVTMDKNTILSKDELAEGLILTCQAHPTTAEITIDFDDL